MGGYGSGNWYRWNSKATTESQHSLDLRYLKNQGLLNPNTFGNLIWSRNGRQTGHIHFWVQKHKVILNYRYGKQGGEQEDIEEVVNFDRTPCSYGRSRKWFLCPRCRRRVLLLYRVEKYFLCRHCHGLTYASQQEKLTDRLTRKNRKIRERLGGGRNLLEPFPFKPKGMHWKTYERLYFEAKQAEALYCKIFSRRFGRVL